MKRHTYGLPKILGFLVRHEPFSFFVLPVGIFERTRCLVTFAISISIVLVLFSYLRTIRLKVSNRGITANGFRKSKKFCDLFRFLNLFFVSIFTGMAQYHLLCFLRKNLFAFFNNLADIILYFPTFYILVSVIKDDKILKRYIRI